MAYWLFKTEPSEFSIDHLKEQQTTTWDGIRNYQARNKLRDEVTINDQVLIYHSSCKVPAIVGIAKVIKAAYPDPSQFDTDSVYFDKKSSRDQPRWYCVDIEYQCHLPMQPLSQIKKDARLAQMPLVQKGNRLSIQPVTLEEWAILSQ